MSSLREQGYQLSDYKAMSAGHKLNFDRIAQVAKALGGLNDQMVFIGGTVVSLLITDSGAPEPRVTKDVDLIVEITTLREREELEEELKKLRFKHDLSDDAHMQRYKLDELIVDIVQQNSSTLGMETPWYPRAVRSAKAFYLENDLSIRLISSPLFLCTKFHAFDGRGKNNRRESKDITDILAVVDGRAELISDLAEADEIELQFIIEKLKMLSESPDIDEVILWNSNDESVDIIYQKLQLVISRASSLLDSHSVG